MRRVLIIVLWTCVFSCKNDNQENKLTETYVQKEEVQLVNPKIQINSMIIDTSSTISASLQLDEAVIYYTTDSSEPTQASKKYTDIILVSNPGTYSFKAFHPDFKPSDTETISFFKKGMDVHDISLVTPLNERYPGKGKNTLVNHKKGTLDFRDGQWMGFTEPFSAIIDFKDVIFLESIDIGYLVNTNAWIFPIQNVSVAASEDGVNFTSIKVIPFINKLDKDITKLGNIHIPVSKELTKIKIEISNQELIPEWHQGKGNPAWMFMDEWIFNGKKLSK